MNKLAIIGAGDLGQLMAFHAKKCEYDVVGFFDDTLEKHEKVRGVTVLGGTANIKACYQAQLFTHIMIAIGYKHFDVRKNLYQILNNENIPFATLIHPSCIIADGVNIGKGCFLLPGCVLDKGVQLKENVLLNTACVIAHDTTVNAHSFFGPGVTLAGFIQIGECNMIGTNATVIDNISIIHNTTVGAGAVVTKNITVSGTYVGVPVKKIK